jgi:putative salt-induced outer membrane protein
MTSLIPRITLALTFASGFVFASRALAQEAPPSLLGSETATTGKEDVATAGFQAPVALPEESRDATELKLSAGGLLAGGNAESIAASTAAKGRARRDSNQVEGALAANYGRATPEGSSAMETNVENLQGKLRYDRFITDEIALFVALTGLRDRFQGLDMRLNLDPGVAYYFIDVEKHRLWVEIGYDYQYELRREDAVADAAAAGTPIERSEDQHAARLFLGYENNLSDAFAFDTGLEYLQPFEETEGWRLNWNVGISSAIGGNFSLAVTFLLRYDHAPLPGIKETDYTTALSLVYQLI